MLPVVEGVPLLMSRVCISRALLYCAVLGPSHRVHALLADLAYHTTVVLWSESALPAMMLYRALFRRVYSLTNERVVLRELEGRTTIDIGRSTIIGDSYRQDDGSF